MVATADWPQDRGLALPRRGHWCVNRVERVKKCRSTGSVLSLKLGALSGVGWLA